MTWTNRRSQTYLEVDASNKLGLITGEVETGVCNISWRASSTDWDRGNKSSSILLGVWLAEEQMRPVYIVRRSRTSK